MKLAADDQLLLIPSGQRARGQSRIRRTHVEMLDNFVRSRLHCAFVDEHPACISSDRGTIMHAKNRVLSKTEIEQQPATVSIFRDVGNGELSSRTSATSGDVTRFKLDCA